MDIEEELLVEKRKNNNFIETIGEARQKLEEELARREVEAEAIKRDKELRKAMMEMLSQEFNIDASSDREVMRWICRINSMFNPKIKVKNRP